MNRKRPCNFLKEMHNESLIDFWFFNLLTKILNSKFHFKINLDILFLDFFKYLKTLKKNVNYYKNCILIRLKIEAGSTLIRC